jgi:hypothetical protein
MAIYLKNHRGYMAHVEGTAAAVEADADMDGAEDGSAE